MAAYPTFTGGYVVQRPWSYRRVFKNVHNDMPHGYRYSYNLRATALMEWEIEYPAFSDTDLATLQSFWESQKGPYLNMDFEHPETAVVYTKVRFAMDSLDIRHVGPNHNSVRVLLREHN